jgi:hypothetical protein
MILWQFMPFIAILGAISKSYTCGKVHLRTLYQKRLLSNASSNSFKACTVPTCQARSTVAAII